jgi:arginine decarboxylase
MDSQRNTAQSVKRQRLNADGTILASNTPSLDDKPDNQYVDLVDVDATNLWGVKSWGDRYFGVNQSGHITVEPTGRGGDAPKIDLYNLVEDCVKRGHSPPLLIRFSNIVDDKIKTLNAAFERSIIQNQYDNSYQQVFPLRVCPSRSVIEEIVKNPEVGLSASSKPELLIVLAMLRTRSTVIICTGYKDREYIETALLAQQLGQRPIIVIEKLLEIDLVLQASQKLGIKPIIGVRTKIVSVPLKNASEEDPSSKNHRYLGFSVDVGDKAKFGLSATEIMTIVQRLKDANLLDSLQMLHFHIGSQISNITSIRQATREASQFYVQLSKLGANMKYTDVGGGLAIDYDGSRTNSPMSMNYSVDEYAAEIVSTIKESCQKNGIFSVPMIISESGRNVTAHHCVVVCNVTDATTVHPLKLSNDNNVFSSSPDVPEPEPSDHELCHKIYELLRNIEPSSLQETIHDARQYKDEALALFTLGMMDLNQRSKIETLFWCCIHDVSVCLKNVKFIPEELEDLRSLLSYTYYVNYSLFQSTPDVWGRSFVFPVAPIHRLNETPEILATLADLTCDSDGKVSCFSSSERRDGSTKELLDLHSLKSGHPYYIGMFLTGAYQEILGSMHNLYGDTHILVVQADADSPLGYTIKHTIPGNTIDDVLRSFQYDPHGMLENVRMQSEKALKSRDMTLPQYRTLVTHYERSLRNYTYLSSEGDADGFDLPPGFDQFMSLDEIKDEKQSDKQSDMSRYIFTFKDADIPAEFRNGAVGGPAVTVRTQTPK